MTRFLREESGQSMVEYALILLMIAAVAVGGFSAFRAGAADMYQFIWDSLGAVL